MKRAVILLVCVAAFAVVVSAQRPTNDDPRSRNGTNRNVLIAIEPEGFLGVRFGNSLQFAEDVFGEPNIKRNGSLEWHFRGGEYGPFEALTIVGDRGKINGFVAHLVEGRIHFNDLSLVPLPNRWGTY